jgi:sugar/nucleoside kinase (ribokinase family)
VVDVVFRVPSLPPRGGDVIASGPQSLPGGGFNVAAAAARQGMRVTYAGAIGVGPTADTVRAALEAERIGIVGRPLRGLDTGTVITFVEPDGERTFVTAPGAEAHLTLATLELARPAPGDTVHVSGYSLAHAPNSAALGKWVTTLPDGVTLIVDPGPLVASLPPQPMDAILARADWVSANASEATAMTGLEDPVEAAEALMVRTGAVVRCGADGCVVAVRGDAPVRVPAFWVIPIDLTGAGDAHVGAFVAALADGATPVQAARLGNASAAFAVTRMGPATGPTTEELVAFLNAKG